MDVSELCQQSYPPITPQLKERIKKINKKIFFILSTARCRSTWFSNLFTYKDSFCYNEETRYINSWEELVDRIEERSEEYVGFEDPELLHYINSLYKLFPNATYVLLERDREDCEISMCNQSGAPRELISMKFDRWEHDLINFNSIVSDYESIHFDDMDDVEDKGAAMEAINRLKPALAKIGETNKMKASKYLINLTKLSDMYTTKGSYLNK